MYSPVESLQWYANPFAIFQISWHEKQVYNTSKIGGELSALLGDVERGKELHKDRLVCLSDACWYGVPWELLEDA